MITTLFKFGLAWLIQIVLVYIAFCFTGIGLGLGLNVETCLTLSSIIGLIIVLNKPELYE